MGINARIESETRRSIQEVPDPRGYTAWLLGVRDLGATVCLKFIDHYGDALFNQIQLPLLLAELEQATGALTEGAVDAAKKRYLERASSWPAQASKQAAEYAASFSIDEIRLHGEQLCALIRAAIARGPHHYVRFVGD